MPSRFCSNVRLRAARCSFRNIRKLSVKHCRRINSAEQLIRQNGNESTVPLFDATTEKPKSRMPAKSSNRCPLTHRCVAAVQPGRFPLAAPLGPMVASRSRDAISRTSPRADWRQRENPFHECSSPDGQLIAVAKRTLLEIWRNELSGKGHAAQPTIEQSSAIGHVRLAATAPVDSLGNQRGSTLIVWDSVTANALHPCGWNAIDAAMDETGIAWRNFPVNMKQRCGT